MKVLSYALIFIIALNCSETRAQYMYVGSSLSYNGVVAEDDFYNGASSWNFGGHVGMATGILSTELFLRVMTMENEHLSAGSTFDIRVKDIFAGIGFRLEVVPGIDVLMGMNYQNVSTNYDSSNSVQSLSNTVDDHFMNYYFGGGFKYEISPRIITRADMVYYKASEDFSLLAFEFGLMYKLIIF